MTITDQIKTLDRTIMQDEAQYDLDRKLLKYLHCLLIIWITSTIEQIKFGFSSLGKNFNKGLSGNDKKEGLFKRLNNIEDKN